MDMSIQTDRIMNALKIDLDISEARLRQFQMADVTTYTPTIEHATPIEPSRLRQGMLARAQRKFWRKPQKPPKAELTSNSTIGQADREDRIRSAKVPERSNIIIFGEAGSGKSSLVNMITGKEHALVANSAAGVTFKSDHYDADFPGGQLVTIWDTAGLDEAPGGTVDAKTAIGNLYKLSRDLDSVHLLVYCVRQRVTKYTVKNYQIFNAICDGKVPIAIVINGLENDPNRGNWWSNNYQTFEKHNITVVAHACVATLKIEGREADYKVWADTVRDVIIEHQRPLENPWSMEKNGWFLLMVKKFVEILFVGESEELFKDFRKHGVSEEDAKEAVEGCMMARSPALNRR